MNHLRLASLFVAPALLASAALACGEISDPTKKSENTATVSGALTGTSVPAGAHVALVWRNGQSGGVVVGADVPIVDGKFTMNLVAPPDAYFFDGSTSSYTELNGGASPPPDTTAPAPAPTGSDSSGPSGGGSTSSTSSGGGANVMQKIGIRTEVSGGITQPLSVAIAGFVVYLDTNGNGTLDLTGDYAGTTDTLLGGNKELLLTYLKGGGSLEYEKLRDKSGILPVQGYNLAWEKGRWLPLGLVELQIIAKPKLPSNVCSSSGVDYATGNSTSGSAGVDPAPSSGPSGGSSGGSSGEVGTTTPPPPGGYPAKGDPYVHCYNSGRSFYYDNPANCPAPPPQPVGLCSYDYEAPYACAEPSYSFAGDTPPTGWPCDYVSTGSSSGSTSSSSGSSGAIDAGSAPDSGL